MHPRSLDIGSLAAGTRRRPGSHERFVSAAIPTSSPNLQLILCSPTIPTNDPWNMVTGGKALGCLTG